MSHTHTRARARSPVRSTYAIAIGSNRPLSARLGPVALVRAAMKAINRPPLKRMARSAIAPSAPLGPSRRRYANAAAIVTTRLRPDALLAHLQSIETHFGRIRQRRWGARTLDLDIILWSGGIWVGPDLAIPHAAFRDRRFVLAPLTAIARQWRDPVSGWTMAQLCARSRKPKPVDRRANRL